MTTPIRKEQDKDNAAPMNHQHSPVLPLTPQNKMINYTTPLSVSPQIFPQDQPPSFQPQDNNLLTTVGLRLVEAQVHLPPQVQTHNIHTHPELETVSLSISCNKCNVSVITHDTISPSVCPSPAGGTGDRVDTGSRQSSLQHALPKKNL